MFTRDDLVKLYGFKAIVQEGDFEIKGKAVQAVAPYFNWFFNELEHKIKGAIAVENKSVPKELKKK